MSGIVIEASAAGNPDGASFKAKGTLEYALRPYRIHPDKLRELHGPVLGMVTKLLGVTPRHCQYLMLWPPGYECMAVLVPNLMNIPFCDFGVGAIGGSMRSLTTYVVSRSYGCGYCAAHCAALGTIWRGDSLFLAKNIAAMAPEPDPEIFNTQELAAINIAKKVGPVPSAVTTEDIRQLACAFSEREQEAVVNNTVVMGFLNRFMDTIGMTLEMEPLEVGIKKLAASGWKAGSSYDKEADAELMAEDRIEAVKRAERVSKSGFFTFVKMLFGAKMADYVSLKTTPSSDKAITERCREAAGFTPYYCLNILHSNAKSALVWAFLFRLNEGSDEVPVRLKQLMCYICATNSGNNILRAHYAFMAFRSGVSITRLSTVATSEVNSDVAEDTSIGAKDVAAMALAEAASGTPSTMSPALVGLLSRQFSPAGVIELVITVSLAFMYHRWTSIYMPEEYEPEVLEFVKEHGSLLGIDPKNPCSPEQQQWAGVSLDIRMAGGVE